MFKLLKVASKIQNSKRKKIKLFSSMYAAAHVRVVCARPCVVAYASCVDRHRCMHMGQQSLAHRLHRQPCVAATEGVLAVAATTWHGGRQGQTKNLTQAPCSPTGRRFSTGASVQTSVKDALTSSDAQTAILCLHCKHNQLPSQLRIASHSKSQTPAVARHCTLSTIDFRLVAAIHHRSPLI
ncbi:hypothetical protein Salat_1446100 [Sesamum alatum]|uniref:Uncharacterized protein n=1 Tax=Sesamum alatum TaxID=300844 RepID=A0AAE1YAP8_9LAMI|nr:hypothetical protein Salat_1446100 [Sesamum alatum]